MSLWIRRRWWASLQEGAPCGPEVSPQGERGALKPPLTLFWRTLQRGWASGFPAELSSSAWPEVHTYHSRTGVSCLWELTVTPPPAWGNGPDNTCSALDLSCFLCSKPAWIRGAEARGGELGLKLNITQRESAKLVSPRRGFK